MLPLLRGAGGKQPCLPPILSQLTASTTLGTPARSCEQQHRRRQLAPGRQDGCCGGRRRRRARACFWCRRQGCPCGHRQPQRAEGSRLGGTGTCDVCGAGLGWAWCRKFMRCLSRMGQGLSGALRPAKRCRLSIGLPALLSTPFLRTRSYLPITAAAQHAGDGVQLGRAGQRRCEGGRAGQHHLCGHAPKGREGEGLEG